MVRQVVGGRREVQWARKAEVFTFEDVVVERAGRRALDGFSAGVPSRGVTAVSGSSGSGKTTLLRLCNGWRYRPAGGSCSVATTSRGSTHCGCAVR